jgi:hypothetical protein
LVHWWNLDRGRPKKQFALEIDPGHIHPTITPAIRTPLSAS